MPKVTALRDQKFVTSLVQSTITCTQEWTVVQYLVNKTNMDSFQDESLSSIMKIAPHSTQSTVHSNSPFLIHFTKFTLHFPLK